MEQSKFYQIKNVTEHEYILVSCDGSVTTLPIQEIDRIASVFNIQDAKEGDVLAFDDDTIVLFKDLYNKTSFHSYCHIEDGVFTVSEKDVPDWWQGEGFYPATKEQRDLLFQKMKEADYEWDSEQKHLKKIEHDLTWSEEDKVKINRIVAFLENLNVADNDILKKDIDWLKSLKDKYTWKPNEKQMNALDSTLQYGKISQNSYEHLNSLINDLKKLREE